MTAAAAGVNQFASDNRSGNLARRRTCPQMPSRWRVKTGYRLVAGLGVSDITRMKYFQTAPEPKNSLFNNRRPQGKLPPRAFGRKPEPGNKEVARMTISPDPDQIRTIVFRTFLELDVDEERLSDLDERIMLDAGRYVARSYRVDDYLAMWMIDVGLVQFYDGEGNMLRTVNLFEEIEPQRMAA
jgi:hypothetical protein